MTNIQRFLLSNSPSQGIFRYTKNGYIILKGQLRGGLVDYLYKANPEQFREYLDDIYNHEDSNLNTKKIIKEIIRDFK